MAMLALAIVAIHSTRLLGVIFAVLVVGYLIFVTLQKEPFRYEMLPLPVVELSHFLGSLIGVCLLLFILTMAKLLGPAPKDPKPPGQEQLDLARQIIGRSPQTLPNLALTGDKELLFDYQNKGFVMYGVERRAWVAPGDPVGPPEVACELAWEYREMVERHGGQTVFYEIGTSMLHVYLDMGLTLFKLGENASVPLDTFSLEGSDRKGLRYTHRHLSKEGCFFEVIPATDVPERLPELRKISDVWLQDKHTREKRFSLGRFDEQYLRNFSIAVVKKQDQIVAFANLWMGANNEDLSFDLMRFGSDCVNIKKNSIRAGNPDPLRDLL